MSYDIKVLVQLAINAKASDIHLHVGESPALRVDGSIVHLEGPVLTPAETERLAQEIVPEKAWASFKLSKEVDFALTLEEINQTVRLRSNVFLAKGHYTIVLRLIYKNVLSIENIGFPSVDVVKNLLKSPRGLIIITGPTGSGKSTTLAAMIDWLNKTQEKHIITIEDPIEYLHDHKKSLITQRELGYDTPSFQRAIVGALRQDPDILLVGEMRDLQTIEATVSAAETGHLVLATLHTTGAARTVDRIVDVFPEGSKELVRTQLASNLVAVISQVLCKKKDGAGRVPAFEIMTRSDSISNLIRERKTFRIQSELEVGQNQGMLTLDRHLFELYKKGLISEDEVLSKAQLPQELMSLLQNPQSVSVTQKKKGLFSF